MNGLFAAVLPADSGLCIGMQRNVADGFGTAVHLVAYLAFDDDGRKFLTAGTVGRYQYGNKLQ